MSDEQIMEIVPKIIQKIPYQSMILNNHEYNEKYSEDINMNKIKAILHNKVLLKMTKQNVNYEYIIVDEFAKSYIYFNYLRKVPEVVRNITFLTKGEDKSLAVACASLISRYIFIKEFDKLSQSLGISLPKGAGVKVDEVGRQIVEKYGFEKLKEVAKLNFKNTEKIKNQKDPS